MPKQIQTMKRLLTKSETKLMNVLWDMPEGQGHGTEIVKKYPDPKPALTTVLTFLKILENKGYVTSRRVGRSNMFIPLVSKDDYRKAFLSSTKDDIFDGTYIGIAKFLLDQGLVTPDEVKALMQ